MIATAAIRVNGEVWTLPRPARHHILIHAWAHAHWRDGTFTPVPDDHEQGFLTDVGRFVDRYEAHEIATASGQLLEAPRAAQLFSEDLW